MELHIQPDWRPLIGHTVDVKLNSTTIRTGTVDAVMEDNSILWLAPAGADTRVMVERADGYTIWIRYKWER